MLGSKTYGIVYKVLFEESLLIKHTSAWDFTVIAIVVTYPAEEQIASIPSKRL